MSVSSSNKSPVVVVKKRRLISTVTEPAQTPAQAAPAQKTVLSLKKTTGAPVSTTPPAEHDMETPKPPRTQSAIPAVKTVPGQRKEKTPAQRAAARRKKDRKIARKVEALVTAWPALFDREAPKPIKVGIGPDLNKDNTARQLGLNHSTLRKGIVSWVGLERYLQAVAAGGPRYDIHGHPCGEVTAEQQQYARKQLARRAKDREHSAGISSHDADDRQSNE